MHSRLLARVALACMFGGSSILYCGRADGDEPSPTTTAPVPAVPPAPPHTVNADGTVTFSTTAPGAKSVEVWGDWPKPDGATLISGADGSWTVTLKIPRGLWAYSYKVIARPTTDEAQATTRDAQATTRDAQATTRDAQANRPAPSKVYELDLPGNFPWNPRPNIPHGTVTIHEFTSKTLNSTQRLRVYTPPDYADNPTKNYPVLYLLHGSGQNDHHWIDAGRANVIMDNFIADGNAVPMIVVTPNGSSRQFSQELLDDIMPLIESKYRTDNVAMRRAIGGLSMGGAQSLDIGLHHPERFAWVGGMSSPVRNPDNDFAPILQPKDGVVFKPGALLWFTCGTEDTRFIKQNEHFDELLTQWQVKHTFVPLPGRHYWPLWRNGFILLVPKLFQP